MPKMTFFPLGNADSCLIDFANGRKALFDFADRGNPDDKNDKRCNLSKLLRADLAAANRNYYDTLAITHLDDDHTAGADSFFYLDHAAKYQGAGRIKIKELWVPAGPITESRNDLKPGAQALQAEARHRLVKGYGIRVFSRPEALRKWLGDRGITLASRSGLITDAGNTIPGYSLMSDGAEFFVHSPFGWRQDKDTVIDRNRDSLVVQLTFRVNGVDTPAILGSDVDHEALTAIVHTTIRHDRASRLLWNVFKLPHHCSYKTLNSEKGRTKTEPVPAVKWLFEQQGLQGGIIISTSDPIPAGETTQPPHFQAANYYKDVAAWEGRRFVVTMQYPSVWAPKPLVISVTALGAQIVESTTAGGGGAKSIPAAIAAARGSAEPPQTRVGFGQ